jgi:predicted N-acetyltransferase YhbS
MKIREVTAEERLTTSVPLGLYAFSPSPGEEPEPGFVPYARESVTLIAEEGGTTLAAVTAIPMRQNVRGVVLPMAGIADVTSHPLARRRGLVRTLMGRLLASMRDAHPVSTLYPFRPSFYERFGYVGFPQARTAAFAPAGLAHLVSAELPGTVVWQHVRQGYDEQRALTLRLLEERHGFAVFGEARAAMLRDTRDRWLVTARDENGDTVGAATYRIERHGGDLVTDTFLVMGAVGRALLLQFFARHVDQVGRVVLPVAPAEMPELWGTDLAVEVTARVAHPVSPAPMGRVLDLERTAGLWAGDGATVVEVVGDELIGGRWRLTGEGGRLGIARTDRAPGATLTAPGLSALLYGVLEVEEVVVRGLGSADAASTAALRRMFPRDLPYLYENF